MKNVAPRDASEIEAIEQREWLESLDYVIQQGDRGRVQRLLASLRHRARTSGVALPFTAVTAYVNTLRSEDETPLPGSQEIERRIKSLVRWNAMAMVVRANRKSDGIGGHISTYASAATLYEVGFNHFFRGRTQDSDGDLVYFQGHASPGIYARAFLEGRLTARSCRTSGRNSPRAAGLSSYPHPWLMPDFWQFPTVSMGLGPIMSIYQARFNRYLEDRGLKKPSNSKVWAFLGDGETDEPESLGAISLAAREKLDNLIFVINCNLQRLDGPVRGNGKIIQELEASFRGAGWNVIKVLWGSDWDPLLGERHEGLLAKRMGEVVDGQYQKYTVESGAYIREHFFGNDPRLLEMVKHLSDDQLKKLRRGGHDPVKVYDAYKAAVEHKGQPTVVLVADDQGLRPRRSGRRQEHHAPAEEDERRGPAHVPRPLRHSDLRRGDRRRAVLSSAGRQPRAPVPARAPQGARRLHADARRRAPNRSTAPIDPLFEEFAQGTEGRKASTTMVFVRILSKLLRDKEIGESRSCRSFPTKRARSAWKRSSAQFGIYSHVGQMYEPVDMDTLLYYKEAKDGQILEEGITEAGSMSSFIAAGTAYATHGINMIPFFIYYSMFGFQRVGDLIWAGADSRSAGSCSARTAGRTTLNGEGLQHQDGHSHVFSLSVPELRVLRSGVRLRARRHHPGRHPPDVQEPGEHLLLPDGDERAVRDAADAGRRARRHPQGPVSFSTARQSPRRS